MQFRFVPAGKRNRFPAVWLQWQIELAPTIYFPEKARTIACLPQHNLISPAPLRQV
jgi:hypothetical protein